MTAEARVAVAIAAVPELAVGDVIVTHGGSGFGPEVTRLDPERALVLGGPPNARGSRATWAFYLLDGPHGSSSQGPRWSQPHGSIPTSRRRPPLP